ncbi:hypothetical protein [Clostridium chromiireducens]|nr:hypothetical protein [Clostridium chromiireducens]
MLVQGVALEASTLDATYNLRITQQNLQRTEANTSIPFHFLSVNSK